VTSDPTQPASQQGPAEQTDAKAKAEAASIAATSPDAALDSAPVSDVEGLKHALLDTDGSWSRDRWFAEDMEVHPALIAIRSQIPEAVVDAVRFRDETTIHLKPEHWRTVCLLLKDRPGVQLNFLTDLTAVDMLRLRENPRFDVVALLYSLPHRVRLRLKTGVNDGETVPSLVPIWNGANWLERECYDMFGITFEGHPNMTRMLLPDDWDEGHPLRKDYPLRGWREFPVFNTERTVGRVRTRWTGRGVS
jgi:NADH-quinone oxidoreductase subunit C